MGGPARTSETTAASTEAGTSTGAEPCVYAAPPSPPRSSRTASPELLGEIGDDEGDHAVVYLGGPIYSGYCSSSGTTSRP